MTRREKVKEKNMTSVVISVCGMAGSGKSTQAKKLATKYGLKYCSGGDALRTLAIEKGYKLVKRGWWERSEGIRFLKERKEDTRFDKAVDRKLLEMAKQGNVVFDSWTMPWLLNNGFKIWLEASQERRAERIAKRDRMSLKEALTALKNKEEHTKAIYKKLYGFNLGEDFQPFDLILDTEHLKADEVFQVLCEVVDNLVCKHNAEGS